MVSLSILFFGAGDSFAFGSYRADIIINNDVPADNLIIALADPLQSITFAAINNKAVDIKPIGGGRYVFAEPLGLVSGQKLTLFIISFAETSSSLKLTIGTNVNIFQYDTPIKLLDGLIMNVTDSLTLGTAGASDTHKVGFDLTNMPIGVKGEIWINFSTGFDVGGISWGEYKDNDTSNDANEPTIDTIDVVAQTVKIKLDDGDDADTGRINLRFAPVNNDTIAGNYHITVMTVDSLQNIVNNPVSSLPFSIVPTALDRVSITPSGNMEVPSDSVVIFSAQGYDRFGNLKTGLIFNWGVTVDSCGTINDGTFRAQKVGSCRVYASANGIADTSGQLSITPGPLHRFSISGTPTGRTAGTPFVTPVVVTAYDINDNVKKNYSGSVYFTSTDNLATLPYIQSSPYQFVVSDSGRHSFPGAGFILRRSGNQTISVTDGSLIATSPVIVVDPTIIDSLSISVASPQTAGIAFNITVNAYDVFDNPTNGVVTISTSYGGGSSPNGVPPVLNNVNVVSGFGQAPQILTNATKTILRAVAGTADVNTDTIFVAPGVLGRISGTGYPSSLVAGQSFPSPANDILVRVYDIYGNLKTNFTDSVYFGSTDVQAVLPAPYRFTVGDAGQHLFAGGGFSLRSAGLQRVIVYRGSIADTSGAIQVNSSGISSFTLSAPAMVTAGSPFLLSVSGAVDSYGNAASGTVSVSAAVGGGLSPGGIPPVYSDIAVSSGSGQGYQTLTNAVATVLAGSSGGFIDSTATITVLPAALGVISGTGYPSSLVAGQSFPSPANDILVRVYDIYGNLKTNFTDSVYFGSTDIQAVLPAPYRFTVGDAGQHLFAGGGFSLRSAGLQRVIVYRGSIADTSGGIAVAAGPINSFTLSAPADVVAGSPFALNVSAAVDAFGNSASGFVTVEDSIGATNSPDGTPPVLNNIIVDAGWGSSLQSLARTGNVLLKGTAGSVVRASNNISVAPAALESFVMSVASPMVSGNPFAAPSLLSAFDIYGNLKTNFNAASDTVVITASTGGPMSNHILRDVDDFDLGQADLAAVGVTYSGIGGQVRFTANSQSGISGQSNLVQVVSVVANQLTLSNRQVIRGNNATGNVRLTNTSSLPVVINSISIFDDSGFLYSPVFNPSLPDTVDPGSVNSFAFSFPVPPIVSFGIHPLSMKLTASYGGLFTSDSLELFTDTLEVMRSSVIEYADSSLWPQTASAGLEYSFVIRLANTGQAALSLSDTSRLIFGEGADQFRANLNQAAVINGGTTVELSFEARQIPQGLAGGTYSAIFKYFGVELGTPVSDSINIPDSVTIESPVFLTYIANSLSPDSLLTGTSIGFRTRINNSGSSRLNLDQLRTTISFGDGSHIYSASLDTNSSVRIDQVLNGDTTLTFRSTAISPQFVPGRYQPVIHIAGVQNSLPFQTDLYPESLQVLTPGALRIDSLYLVCYNPPRVNTQQPFIIRGRISNLGVDPVDSISLLLSSDGASVFSDTLLLGTLDGLSARSFNYNIVAAVNPDPAEIFQITIIGSRSRFTGQSAQVLPPLDNSAAVVVERPASLVFDTIYVSDESLSTGQIFTVFAVVSNNGSQSYSGSNKVEIDFHGDPGFQTVDSTQRDISFGQTLSWRVRAPQTIRQNSLISARFFNQFIDLNDSTSALGQDSIANINVSVSNMASIEHRARIISPLGATDNVISTSQGFVIADSLFLSGNSTAGYARIYLPDGFSSSDPLVQSTNETAITWRIQAPESPTFDSITIDCWTFDFNNGDSVYDSRITIPLEVQRRAILDIGLDIVSPPSALDRIVEPSGYFVLSATVNNIGEAPTGPGNLTLSFGAPGFQSSEPLVRQFVPGTPVTWTITAPSQQILTGVVMSVELTQIPIDSNSNSTAFVITDSAGLVVIVKNELPYLVLRDILASSGAAVKGQPFEILRLTLQNSIQITSRQIGITSVSTKVFSGSDSIPPSNLLQAASLSLGEQTVNGVITDTTIDFEISPPFTIEPDSLLQCLINVTPKQNASVGNFSLAFRSNMIVARVMVDGVTEQLVRVQSPDGSDFAINSPTYILVDPEFMGSVKVDQNPFLPSRNPLRIGFNLTEPATLEFSIYDINGIKVWGTKGDFSSGSFYSTENAVTWDGRTMSGEKVLSGVYYLFVKNIGSNQVAKLKIAVVW